MGRPGIDDAATLPYHGSCHESGQSRGLSAVVQNLWAWVPDQGYPAAGSWQIFCKILVILAPGPRPGRCLRVCPPASTTSIRLTTAFIPHLEILPLEQREIWAKLAPIGEDFVLYGGTALALRLKHRPSIDFDFFTETILQPEVLLGKLPFLKNATVLQSQTNTYTFQLPIKQHYVKLSFFGDLDFGRVGEPEPSSDGILWVASLQDLLATKLKVLMQRIERKDYVDIAALLRHGLSLGSGLAAAQSLFGNTFSPVDCLRALEYFEDPQLADLSRVDRLVLQEAVKNTLMLDSLPLVPIVSRTLGHG